MTEEEWLALEYLNARDDLFVIHAMPEGYFLDQENEYYKADEIKNPQNSEY